mmetsp:Transcript_129952/g.323854  ORF Transcript_129952/g.323854 Transcript_129952/m.323854 type:complete len:118 (+) Transcript_129952:1073-1426(+)
MQRVPRWTSSSESCASAPEAVPQLNRPCSIPYSKASEMSVRRPSHRHRWSASSTTATGIPAKMPYDRGCGPSSAGATPGCRLAGKLRTDQRDGQANLRKALEGLVLQLALLGDVELA